LNSVDFKLGQSGSNGYGLERPKGSQGNWELTIIISKSHHSQCGSWSFWGSVLKKSL